MNLIVDFFTRIDANLCERVEILTYTIENGKFEWQRKGVDKTTTHTHIMKPTHTWENVGEKWLTAILT